VNGRSLTSSGVGTPYLSLNSVTDDEYNDWYTQGYAGYDAGYEGPPEDATDDESAAWWDGYNTAREEAE
jgi:hypothetical protein